MNEAQTIELLRRYADKYNDMRYFEEDPIIFPKHFAALLAEGKASLQDVETAAAIAAHRAAPNVELIRSRLEGYAAADVPDPEEHFYLRVTGDSMINARIFDGDVVYIRQQQTVENGEIAAVLIDNEATLKRVQLFDDHIILQPENPMYKPLAFWGEEMNTVQILGKAVAFTSAVI